MGLQSGSAGERLPQKALQPRPPLRPGANRCSLQLQKEQKDLSFCRRKFLEVTTLSYPWFCEAKTLYLVFGLT